MQRTLQSLCGDNIYEHSALQVPIGLPSKADGGLNQAIASMLLSVHHSRNATMELSIFSHWDEYKGRATLRLPNYPSIMEFFPTSCICFNHCNGPSLTRFPDFFTDFRFNPASTDTPNDMKRGKDRLHYAGIGLHTAFLPREAT